MPLSKKRKFRLEMYEKDLREKIEYRAKAETTLAYSIAEEQRATAKLIEFYKDVTK